MGWPVAVGVPLQVTDVDPVVHVHRVCDCERDGDDDLYRELLPHVLQRAH